MWKIFDFQRIEILFLRNLPPAVSRTAEYTYSFRENQVRPVLFFTLVVKRTCPRELVYIVSLAKLDFITTGSIFLFQEIISPREKIR